jgi:lysophospholipase L1-like esterase
MRLFVIPALVALLLAAGQATGAEPSSPTLFLIGDSTVASQAVVPAQPLRGWGQVIPMYLKQGMRVENHASSGQSSRSFFLTGRWKVVHERLKAGDFLIIQFGHNDGKPDEKRHTEAFGEYTENLLRYVRETRERGATPILATPPCRAVFDKEGKLTDTHRDYPKAMRQVAEKEKAPLLDLEGKTAELLRHLGPERAKALFANSQPTSRRCRRDGRMARTSTRTGHRSCAIS